MTPKLGSHAHKGLVHDPYELGATGVARTRRMGAFITMIKATVISSFRNLGLSRGCGWFPARSRWQRQPGNRECAGFQNLLYRIALIRFSLVHYRLACCIGSSFKAVLYTP